MASGQPVAGIAPLFGTVSERQTCDVPWMIGVCAASSATSPPSAGVRYGAVPFCHVGSVTSACSSSKALFAAPQARTPSACGHGEGATPHLTQPVTAGGGAAAIAAPSFATTSTCLPTVNTV